jgi:hypothetical protein
MLRAEVTVIQAVSRELASGLRRINCTFINESTGETSNRLGACACRAVMTEGALVLLAIAENVTETSNITVVTTQAHLAVVNTRLVEERLESTLGAVRGLLRRDRAVSARRASLRDSRVVVTVFAWLAHSALRDLLGSSCVRESTNWAQNR